MFVTGLVSKSFARQSSTVWIYWLWLSRAYLGRSRFSPRSRWNDSPMLSRSVSSLGLKGIDCSSSSSGTTPGEYTFKRGFMERDLPAVAFFRSLPPFLLIAISGRSSFPEGREISKSTPQLDFLIRLRTYCAACNHILYSSLYIALYFNWS